MVIKNFPSFKPKNMNDQKFGPAIRNFSLTIPKDYNHDTYIDTFTKKTKNLNRIYRYNDDFTSKNFSNASNRLIPRLTYGIKLFPVVSTATTQDCINFLREQKNLIWAGAHGLTLVEELKFLEFPWRIWVVSFDKRKFLPKFSDGTSGVPAVHHKLWGDRGFGIFDFDSEWSHIKYPEVMCLLCFYNKSRRAQNRRYAG